MRCVTGVTRRSSTKTESEGLRHVASPWAKAALKARLAFGIGRSRNLVFLLVGLMLLVGSVANSDEPVGTIQELRGTAQVYRAAQAIVAAVGVFVMLGDRIETPR